MNDPRVDAVLAHVRLLDPIDDRERRSIDQILAIAPTLGAPFDETASEVHLTGSAFIVGVRGTILHRHRRLGIWVQPGGHVDDGERPPEAALREGQEETGLRLLPVEDEPTLVHVDVHPGPRGHTHLDLRYLFVAGAVDPAPPPDESQDVRWLDFDSARALGDPGLLGAIGRLEQLWRLHGDRWRAMVEA